MAGPKFHLAALFVTRGARSLRSSRLAIRNFRLGRYPHILLANSLHETGRTLVPLSTHSDVAFGRVRGAASFKVPTVDERCCREAPGLRGRLPCACPWDRPRDTHFCRGCRIGHQAGNGTCACGASLGYADYPGRTTESSQRDETGAGFYFFSTGKTFAEISSVMIS